MAQTALTVAKHLRTIKKVVIKNIFPKGEAVIEKYRTTEAIGEAAVLIQTLEEMKDEIQNLDDKVADLMGPDDDLEKQESEAYEFIIALRNHQAKMRSFIDEDLGSQGATTPNRAMGVKLPKIKIKSFSGETMDWQPFKESFDATIHDRNDLTDEENSPT